MSLYAYGNTAKGTLPVNDDSYYIGDIGDYLVLSVADGNGGKPDSVNIGQVANNIVRDYFEHTILNNTNISLRDLRSHIDNVFYLLSRAFRTINVFDEHFGEINCSMSLVVIEKLSLNAYISSIGSCETQLVRNGQFRRINDLYTEAFQLVKTGEITADDVYRHPKRAILTSAFGVFDNINYDVQPVQLQKDDILLMTTDGLYRVTTPAGVMSDFIDLQTAGKTINESVDAVLQKANEYEANDNSTLLLLYVPDDNSAGAAQYSEHNLSPISSNAPRQQTAPQQPMNQYQNYPQSQAMNQQGMMNTFNGQPIDYSQTYMPSYDQPQQNVNPGYTNAYDPYASDDELPENTFGMQHKSIQQQRNEMFGNTMNNQQSSRQTNPNNPQNGYNNYNNSNNGNTYDPYR